MSTTPRTLPSYDTEPFPRPQFTKQYLSNCLHSYDHLNLIWDKCYTHETMLQQLQLKQYRVSMIVPTSIVIDSVVELSYKRYLTICDDNGENSHIKCSKRSFGNWKVEVYGTKEDIMDVGYTIMMKRLEKEDYITLEISKETNLRLCDLKILDRNDITLIPTGYNGYLVNVMILQENIYPLLNELILIYNDPANIVSIKRQTILQSINELSLPKPNSITVLKPTESITKLIQLTKWEVSCLLEKDGKWFESIRNKTGCNIVIMPISPSNQFVLSGNKRIPQFIKLFGTQDKVDNAQRIILNRLKTFPTIKRKSSYCQFTPK